MTDLPCKDCKFCKTSWFPNFWNHYEYATCHAPHTYKTSTVSGHLAYERSFCDIERKYDHRCGPEAKHFEPKASKGVKYYDLMQKKKRSDEAMEKMWADLRDAKAKVWENIAIYALPNRSGHFDLNHLKEQYLNGTVTDLENELTERDNSIRKEITAQVKTEVKKDAATLIRKKYRGQKLIMENPENLAKLIEDMQ